MTKNKLVVTRETLCDLTTDRLEAASGGEGAAVIPSGRPGPLNNG